MNLNKNKNLFLSSCYGYQWNNIKNWVISLRNTNIEDDVCIISYTKFDEITISNLKKFNVNYIYENNNLMGRIVVERFYSYFNYLQNCNYNYVFLFDLADIVFQKNPVEWLDNNIEDKKIVVGSECIRYKDEYWGKNNFKQSFGYFYDFIKDKIIYNAGSFGGLHKEISNLSCNIYSLSKNNPCPNPDQAAFNLLLQTSFHDISLFSDMDSAWSCQCGTVLDPSRMNTEPYLFSKYITENPPYFNGNKVLNASQKEFYLIHQYNRVPELSMHYFNLYKDL